MTYSPSLQTNNCSLHKKLFAFHVNVEDYYQVREKVIMAKNVKIVAGLRRCVLNISNSLCNYTASHAKDNTARFSPRQQQLAARPYPKLYQFCLNLQTPFSFRSVLIISIRTPCPPPSQAVPSHQVFGLNFCMHLSSIHTCYMYILIFRCFQVHVTNLYYTNI